MKICFLFIFFILLNIISNQGDDYDPTAGNEQEETRRCEDQESVTPCRERILTGGRLCCDIHESTADSISETCEVKTTKEEQMKIVGSSYTINKEFGGLQIYNKKYGGVSGETLEERKEQVQRTISITCETWDFSVNIIDGSEYTEEEIKILESDNHCLTYFEPILKHIGSNRRNVTRETCYKASLLPSTKEEGISCGYMEIFIEEPHAIEKRTTCFLYDPKVASSKTLDEATRLNLNMLCRKAEDDSINYNYTIYSRNGSGYIFDSKTRKVTPTEDNPSNFNYDATDLEKEEQQQQRETQITDKNNSNNNSNDNHNETITNYGIINHLSISSIILIMLFFM